MDFLQLAGKRFLIFGVANKKSIAFAVSRMLIEEGSECVFVVQNQSVLERASKLFPDSDFYTCSWKRGRYFGVRRKIGVNMIRLTVFCIPLPLQIIQKEWNRFMKRQRKRFCRQWASLVFINWNCQGLCGFIETRCVRCDNVNFTTRMAGSYGYMAPIGCVRFFNCFSDEVLFVIFSDSF